MPSALYTFSLAALLMLLAFYWGQRFGRRKKMVSPNQPASDHTVSPVLVLHIKNSPLAVIEWDSDFRIKQWSKRAEEMFGWTAEEVLGKHPHEIGYVHEDDVQGVSEVVAGLTSGQRTRSINRNRNYHKDGTVLYCEWYESVLFDENGSFTSIWSLVQDVTERVEAEEALHELNVKLEERIMKRTAQLMVANKELESFAFSVSHDLRAPLRAIDGFSQALLEEYETQLDETGQHYLHRIRQGSQRMGWLIDDLLLLSRITRQEMQQDSVNLSELALEILHEQQAADPERKVVIEVASDLIDRCDPSLMRVALQNLLDNAWKFSSIRPLPQIELGSMKIDGEQVYFVRDNGAGFDMVYADKLFNPFQRLHHQDEFPGTGIGLATVQRIIHRHNGCIWAESAVQQGTTFYFTLG